MASASQFSVGIIGAGNVVAANHLPVLQAMNNVRVSWIADLNFERARTIGRAYSVPYFAPSEDLANLPSTDAVLLAIPYGARDAYYPKLSRRGAAIYVEKPFARTVAMHRDICKMFASHEIGCGLNRRAWGIVALVRRIVQARLFGKIERVRFGSGLPGGISVGQTYLSDAQMSGGGMLFEMGVHGIDTVLYCLDVQSLELQSGNIVLDHGHDVHCEGVFSVRDSTGQSTPFEIEVSLLKKTINRVEFEFESAILHFSIFGSPSLEATDKDGKFLCLLNDRHDCYPATWNQVLFEFWQTFLFGVCEQKLTYTSASTSVLTTQAIEELYALADQQ